MQKKVTNYMAYILTCKEISIKIYTHSKQTKTKKYYKNR